MTKDQFRKQLEKVLDEYLEPICEAMGYLWEDVNGDEKWQEYHEMWKNFEIDIKEKE